MLESTEPSLLEPGGAHHACPDKARPRPQDPTWACWRLLPVQKLASYLSREPRHTIDLPLYLATNREYERELRGA